MSIQLSMTLNMGMDTLLSMPIMELLDIILEVDEVVSERKRIQARNQDSRHHR